MSNLKNAALAAFVLSIVLSGCGKPTPLTAQKADVIVRSQMPDPEPVYAEVPQKVWFGPKSPEDDFDQLSVRTLDNLRRAGLVTVEEKHDPDGMTTYQAHVTRAGFNILGTMPSARGPVYRGKICEKKIDGTRNFLRHPNDPHVGRVELVWHYTNPTPLYALFETKMNKPLNHPFVSMLSIWWEKHQWKSEVIVRKADA